MSQSPSPVQATTATLTEWHGTNPVTSSHPAGMTILRFGMITYFILPDGSIWEADPNPEPVLPHPVNIEIALGLPATTTPTTTTTTTTTATTTTR